MRLELIGPTGHLIKGNVLDVSLKPFLRALQDYDPQLYVKWNPQKLQGWGCWEIRRKPEHPQIVQQIEFNSATYTIIDYKENAVLNHVLDCAFLNYDVLRKLRAIDMWRNDNWLHDIEYLEEQAVLNGKERAKKSLSYALKQNRTAMRDLKQMILSGVNPHIIANEVGRLMAQKEE